MAGSYDFPFTIMDVAALLRLRVRRRLPNSVYVDCPICKDNRGKMNLDTVNDRWRCNYCGEGGGMLKLYGMVHNISNSEAYREICDTLQTGYPTHSEVVPKNNDVSAPVKNSELAPDDDIHKTLSLMLQMLKLSDSHREQLRARGLTDAQIDKNGYKSTPSYFSGPTIAERLIKQGCTVQGVPGFYLGDNGKWTVKFSDYTAGILIPIRALDEKIRGCQIRLDVPIKDKNDSPEKEGTKYIWLSSVNKSMGVSSGSPVHITGNPNARTFYLTEGALKGDVAGFLMNRSFVCTAGANNYAELETIFAMLAENGTKLIVESHDMDKYRNEHIVNGAANAYSIARKYGLETRRLTWNPNYKGIDDWQLALKVKKEEGKNADFNEQFISAESRARQKFRIYQLDFTSEIKPKKFAFMGIDTLRKEGYEQPPASEYRLVYDSEFPHIAGESAEIVLSRIFERFNDILPNDYFGRCVAPSDVVELYSDEGRRYYYCDGLGKFAEVKFSPMLALPMKSQE